MLSLPLPKKNNPTKAKTPASRSGSRANTRPRCLRCQQGDTAGVTAAECPWLAIGMAEGQCVGATETEHLWPSPGERILSGDVVDTWRSWRRCCDDSWRVSVLSVAVLGREAQKAAASAVQEVHQRSRLEIKQRAVSSWTQIGACSLHPAGFFTAGCFDKVQEVGVTSRKKRVPV